jgi:hypothetical protein
MYKVELYTNNLHRCGGGTGPPTAELQKVTGGLQNTMINRVVRDDAPGEGKFQL